MLLTQLTPNDYAQTFLVMYLASVTYGAVGIFVGSFIPGELEGSFALMFFFVMDAFIGSPLFGTTTEAFAFLPTFYPTKVLLALTAGQPHDADPLALHRAVPRRVVVTIAAAAFSRAARLR